MPSTHFHRTLPSLAESDAPPKAVKVIYKSKSDFKAAVKVLGIMDDSKSGVPRMAYKGVVPTFYKGIRVYLSPGGESLLCPLFLQKHSSNLVVLRACQD